MFSKFAGHCCSVSMMGYSRYSACRSAAILIMWHSQMCGCRIPRRHPTGCVRFSFICGELFGNWDVEVNEECENDGRNWEFARVR